MTTVSIANLQANLPRYLREVQQGSEIQVFDQGRQIARLVPSAAKDDREARDRLIKAGILRPGKGNAAAILDRPPLVLSTSLSEALDEDRTDRL